MIPPKSSKSASWPSGPSVFAKNLPPGPPGEAEGALVIPKEALRHDAQGDYVYTLKDGTLERRAVKKGIAGITQGAVK